jgi:hypothetical protein
MHKIRMGKGLMTLIFGWAPVLAYTTMNGILDQMTITLLHGKKEIRTIDNIWYITVLL